MSLFKAQLIPKPKMSSKISPNEPKEGGLKVIAAGLPRCATSSLKEAFESQLEVGPCMHMNRCVLDPKLMKLVHDAMLEKDALKRRAILYQLFSGYAASADFPGELFLADLVEMYPDAKYILNIRKDGAKGWLKSFQPTIGQYMTRSYMITCIWSRSDRWHYWTNLVWDRHVREQFGVVGLCSTETYDRHNEWVRGLMAEKKIELFEWEPTMGWQGLCAFLGRKAPAGGFPRKNDQKHMTKVRYFLMGRGILLWARAFAVPVAAYFAAAHYGYHLL